MKRIFIPALMWMLASGWAYATLYTQTFSGGSVAAGNSVPTLFSGTFDMDPNSGGAALAISIQLDITGGYSGGFYLALTGPDGDTTSILLNQPGTSTSGLNVTFADGGTAINFNSDLSSGTYAPNTALSGLDGQLSDGLWTLAFANTTSGSAATLNSWTLAIDPVPEPVNVALAVFGLILAGWRGLKWAGGVWPRSATTPKRQRTG